jgi:hypothetical protein
LIQKKKDQRSFAATEAGKKLLPLF